MVAEVVPPHLVGLGQQALANVTISVASGEPLVRCQLLASEFYEALKRELRAPELSPAERWTVMAAATQCCHAANASIGPDAMLGVLRTALALLQFSGGTPARTNTRPVLRVIEGGLSRTLTQPVRRVFFRFGCSDSSDELRGADARPFILTASPPAEGKPSLRSRSRRRGELG
jgi:hypothetical protein